MTEYLDRVRYEFSRDYDALLEMMAEARVVCFLGYPIGKEMCCTDVGLAKRSPFNGGYVYEISVRGHGYCWAETKEDFIFQCRACDVRFLQFSASSE